MSDKEAVFTTVHLMARRHAAEWQGALDRLESGDLALEEGHSDVLVLASKLVHAALEGAAEGARKGLFEEE